MIAAVRARDRLKHLVPPILVEWRRPPHPIADRHLYKPWLRYEPLFAPWLADRAFANAFATVESLTMLDVERAWILWSLVRQTAALNAGDVAEMGVFRGGSALLIWKAMRRARSLHLFDTFSGMPSPGAGDLHHAGDLADTSVDRVDALFRDPRVVLHAGEIPATFARAGITELALAHVDLDLEQSVRDACAFAYPRLVPGGILVFDDYGFSSTPGARAAVDDFFRDRPEVPLVLPTGQAIVMKLP